MGRADFNLLGDTNIVWVELGKLIKTRENHSKFDINIKLLTENNRRSQNYSKSLWHNIFINVFSNRQCKNVKSDQ